MVCGMISFAYICKHRLLERLCPEVKAAKGSRVDNEEAGMNLFASHDASALFRCLAPIQFSSSNAPFERSSADMAQRPLRGQCDPDGAQLMELSDEAHVDGFLFGP